MKNNLSNQYPNLAKEWDYDLNGDLKPGNVPPKGRAYVFWKCKKGHSYRAKIASRANGSGCPYCKGAKVSFERSIAGKRQELLAMWDFKKNKISPDQVLAGSNKKFFWICDKGHSFDAPPKQMARKRTTNGCPYCRGLRVNKKNSLATLYPTLVDEWIECVNDISITPNDVTPGCSSKKVQWRCKRGHMWVTTPKHRALAKTGCPKCKQERKISKQSYILFFYLKKYFKDVKMEVPLENSRMSLDIYIPCLNLIIEYDGEIYHKNINRDLNKDKELLKQRPKDIIIRIREPECPEYNSPNPNVIFYKLDTHLQKDFQRVVEMIFYKYLDIKASIDFERDNIKILELIDHSEYKNSLASIKPELIKEWDYKLNGKVKPEFFRVSSHEKVHWICYKGHSWVATIASRTNGGNNCPFCSNRRLNSENNLALLNPKLSKEWHPTKNKRHPHEYFANSHFKVWWLCKKCEHEWKASIYNRNGNGSGCPSCCYY
ncbi:zinc-ribbon domain-containing protein [Virgibacillus halodenitrificans]|uniref:zinc-ribbon domain-containing protein n=1 Tax=Virgibacillus halodenitrificans TaxID=1482 RepID=UPI0024C003ED|nr:zinc-ribbon domain-containing protein [Virgibacillus halodenitrificans]WHX25121.1 zinc-ribbon domain-containing protein [Virgibacillus halodenitrificans]